jgi:hypothetical protein
MPASTALSARSIPAADRGEWVSPKALSHVLVAAAGFCVAVALIVLVALDGWSYYNAPLASRGYLPQHSLLRPSGRVGLTLGIAGLCSMLFTLPYALRKRWRRLSKLGTLKGWLETHIFFGVVGPVLVTFHTSFKFNGIVSVAYWLMMLVWTSGFVGRYLYVRIPKTIRGAELSRADIEQELEAVRTRLALLPEAARNALDAFDRLAVPGNDRVPGAADLFLGELRARTRLALLRRRLRALNVDVDELNSLVTLAFERASLTRRLAHLERTRHLFELWHVFHRPLVYAMFAIVAVHVGIAIYFGYGRFLR